MRAEAEREKERAEREKERAEREKAEAEREKVEAEKQEALEIQRNLELKLEEMNELKQENSLFKKKNQNLEY